MKRFYLKENEVRLVASTPKTECWICNMLIRNIYKDDLGYYLKDKKVIDDGIEEHLRQLINRDIVFE
jgi:hypothetical protein